MPLTSGSPVVRQEAAIEFAGWAATKISTRFPRLRQALGGGSPHDVHRALLGQLPAAVLEAWYDVDPNEDPHVVRSHAANLLSDEMLAAAAISGTPDDCRRQLQAYENLLDTASLYAPTFGVDPARVSENHRLIIEAA